MCTSECIVALLVTSLTPLAFITQYVNKKVEVPKCQSPDWNHWYLNIYLKYRTLLETYTQKAGGGK